MNWMILLGMALAADPGGRIVLAPCPHNAPEEAVVRVRAGEHSYDGAVISPAGFLVTTPAVARHLATTVTFSDGRVVDAEVLRASLHAAILRVPVDKPLACFIPANAPPDGGWVSIVRRTDAGLVRTRAQRRDASSDVKSLIPLVPPDADFRPAGSPVLTDEGELVGLLDHPKTPSSQPPSWSIVGLDTAFVELFAVLGAPVTPLELFEHGDDAEEDEDTIDTPILPSEDPPSGPGVARRRAPHAPDDGLTFDCPAFQRSMAPAPGPIRPQLSRFQWTGAPVTMVTTTGWGGRTVIAPAFPGGLDAARAGLAGATAPRLTLLLANNTGITTTLVPRRLTSVHDTLAANAKPQPWGELTRDQLHRLGQAPIASAILELEDDTIHWPSPTDRLNRADAERQGRDLAYLHAYLRCLDDWLTSVGL